MLNYSALQNYLPNHDFLSAFPSPVADGAEDHIRMRAGGDTPTLWGAGGGTGGREREELEAQVTAVGRA
jgi:hypothetical protein